MYSHLSILFDTPTLTIGYDPLNDWLYADWKGFHDDALARQSCDQILTHARQFPCAKLLNDNSNLTGSSWVVTDWSIKWLDEMHQAGLQAIAWVYHPEHTVQQASEDKIKFSENVVVAPFADLASGCEWLQNFAPVRTDGVMRSVSEPATSYLNRSKDE